MTSDELLEKLTEYIGRRCRIYSNATPALRVGFSTTFPVLEEVSIRESDDAVCCQFSGGLWYIVESEGLEIELSPAVGTFDFAEPVDQMRAIGTTLTTYKDMVESQPKRRRGKSNGFDWSSW